MIWVPVLILAALAFLAGAFILRLPHAGYTLLGAALLFGLAGYALQGSPGQPAAPGRAVGDLMTGEGELLVSTRRAFYDPAILPSRFLITSDAFARRGDAERAAGFARSAVLENPDDGEAWTALGNALVEHADGRLTPAALYAFRRGQKAAPARPAPGFFLGLALLRAGDFAKARALWADVLDKAPADAPWRAAMAVRLERLDTLMAARR